MQLHHFLFWLLGQGLYFTTGWVMLIHLVLASGHGAYCIAVLAPLHQYMSGRWASYLLLTLKSCLLYLHLFILKRWITWFSGVHIPYGVWVAARCDLAGLFWAVWVVAFWRALWREITFLFQSPTIKDWFSPGSKG